MLWAQPYIAKKKKKKTENQREIQRDMERQREKDQGRDSEPKRMEPGASLLAS